MVFYFTLRALPLQDILPGQYGIARIKICKNHLPNGGPHTGWAEAQSRIARAQARATLFFYEKAPRCLLPGHRGGNALMRLSVKRIQKKKLQIFLQHTQVARESSELMQF